MLALAWSSLRYHQRVSPATGPSPGFQVTRFGEVSCGFVAFQFLLLQGREGGKKEAKRDNWVGNETFCRTKGAVFSTPEPHSLLALCFQFGV